MIKNYTATEMQMRTAEAAVEFGRVRDKVMQPFIDRMYDLVLTNWSINKYLFEARGALFYDWGHFLRATGGQWTWQDRVLAWNPCNHIGHLNDY